MNQEYSSFAEHPLVQVSPLFLKELDLDPNRSAKSFYEFLSRLLAAVPPPAYARADSETQADMKMQITLHCIKDSFRVLKAYRPQQRPFSAWLRQVAANQVADYFRANRSSFFVGAEVLPLSDNQVGTLDTRHQASDRDILEKVRRCMTELDTYCQLLLQMAADEFLPREMALVMRWPTERAKKISDDLRYCRKKLVGLLGKKGISEESMV